ncbi:MAG: hypothetical protein ACRC92_23050 [Peptostreptococcaceae bacterium]
MNDQNTKKFNLLIFTIYILSIIYFLFKKDYSSASLSFISLVISIVLCYIYKRNIEALDFSLYIVLNLFVLASFVLGSSYKLYDKIKYYDDFLHFWSGFISVKIGWNIFKNIKLEKINKILLFTILLLFAMGIASICEISEYLLDTIFKMQTQSGGLKDTMHDMIDALIGAIIMLIYLLKKYNTALSKKNK